MDSLRPLWRIAVILLALAPGLVQADAIRLETDLFRLEVSAEGQSTEFVDLGDGQDYVRGKPEAFAMLVEGVTTHEAAAVRREGDRLHVSFADTDTKAVIRVERHPQWLVFELEGLSNSDGVEELIFLNVRTSIQGRKLGLRPGCVNSETFTIGCQALNRETESQLKISGREVSLRGRCYKRFGLEGARVALFAAPSKDVLEIIEAIEITEPAVPHPTLDGVWARKSPDSRKSYLFIDMTERNADEIIAIAKELNFGYILVYANTWANTLGSYEINLKNYPNGMESFKAVSAKAHAAGLKVGIHCLTGFVNKKDPLVAPVPDSRLAKDGKVTLAADVDEKVKFIPSVESPADFPSDIAYGPARQGFDVQIDDEIISYRGISTAPSYGLDKCVRGAYGTRRAAHQKGATVWHLTQRYSNYLADCDKGLALEIAKRYAEVINSCELDMIYFDGASANSALGERWKWRYVQHIPLESQALWNREVRAGGSCNGPLYWHMRCFMTCNDFVEIAVKRFLDHDKLRSASSGKVNYLPVDLGWWGFHTWAPHRRSTTPDEIEYICQKSIGFDTFWSLETTLRTIKKCGRWPDIKETITRYEELRLKGHFPEEVKEAIRQKGAEFKLIADNGQEWRLAPVEYGPPRVLADEETRSWTLDNDLASQPLRFRLYALPTVSAYDATENRVLLGQADPSRYVKTRTQTDCKTDLQAVGEKTPDGEDAVSFAAASELSTAEGWAEHRADLAGIGQRTGPPALIEGLPEEIATTGRWSRPLGVWVHGDGQGEVLNVQLRASNGGYRDHYIDVDFTGWKYCQLTRPETDRVFDFDAGYSRKHTVRHFQYDRIGSIFLRYNSIPANSEVRCLIGPIKALREKWHPVENPAIEVGGRKIVFPCRLETEQYLEFDGGKEARVFDREGQELRRIEPQGATPRLAQGKNRVTFSSEVAQEGIPPVEISIIRIGDPSHPVRPITVDYFRLRAAPPAKVTSSRRPKTSLFQRQIDLSDL